MAYLNPELSYVGSYAIHRGKQFEQDIWSVIGLIQLIDITAEVLSRQKLVGEHKHKYSGKEKAVS